MINEEKIKLMTKMAIYESGQGKADTQISHYHKAQYIKIEVVKSMLINSVVYVCLVSVGLLLFLDQVIIKLNAGQHKKYIVLLIFGYVMFMLIEGFYSHSRASEKYDEAQPRIRQYRRDLNKLFHICKMQEETKIETIEEEVVKEELDGDRRENIDF